MIKPEIIFSHSSFNKDYVAYIKTKILDKTQNTIDIIQTSDSEFHIFDNNWINKIEDRLKSTKLVFIFISKYTLKSNWIYFESSLTYSKGITAIHIGINNVDVNTLPPINYLPQNININSHEDLNKIIDVINNKLNCGFTSKFNENDYYKLLQYNDSYYNNYVQSIAMIEFKLHKQWNKSYLKDDATCQITSYLTKNNIKYYRNLDHITLRNIFIKSFHDNITIKILNEDLKKNIDLVHNLINTAYTSPIEKHYMQIKLSNVDLLNNEIEILSILKNYNIGTPSINSSCCNYKNISFILYKVDENLKETDSEKEVIITIDYNTKSLDFNIILELINLLFETKIVWKTNN